MGDPLRVWLERLAQWVDHARGNLVVRLGGKDGNTRISVQNGMRIERAWIDDTGRASFRGVHGVSYFDLDDVPPAFTPAAHTHAGTDIISQVADSVKWAGLRVIASGTVTLQPSLSTGNWLYSNTQIAIPSTTGAYRVLTSIADAPATVWVTDQAATSFVLWAAIDTALTNQAATPTIWYLVVQ